MKKKLTALLASAAMTISAIPNLTAVNAADTVKLTAGGWFETAYCQWEPVSGASGYNVYVDGNRIDSMLIRQYNGYYRADALGLKAGSHTMKVVPTSGNGEDSGKAAEQTVTVTAHDRSGFGFVNGTSSGAYNDDGTLRNGAVVLYVTEDTKNTVSMEVVTDSKGGKTSATGIQNILTAYQKGYDSRPLDIRCIGNITDPATLMDGDLLVKGNGASKRLSSGVTVEGVGTDTVFNGFGLRIANSSNVEVRNIGFMNCNSGEGDNVGLQQNNDHVWVHNCDMFYGDAGSDADQVKGDGALDTKTSTFITHSYNHFWDNGKCNLQGMKSESPENYITYHHNWYDHSDSRHPRIRTCSVHIYNNYFDGNAKYGVGVTMGASAFVDSNYFRNCPKPMMSSMQGTDAIGDGTFSSEAGGIIKAYNNVMVDAKSYITYQTNNKSFDAYEVSNAKDTVPASVKTVKGETSYNNFDTSSVMYNYKADAPADVPAKVTANAGRINGGDFKWQFDNSVDDASYAVNQALKNALVAYKTSIVKIGSGAYVTPTDQPSTSVTTTATTTGTQPTETQPTNTQPTGTQPVGTGYIQNFTQSGTASDFYTISGNLSTSKGTVNYAGLTLTQCLKMESATNIAFSAPADGRLTLVFAEAAATAKIDGTKTTATDGIITVNVAGGSHTITKADTANLFYMMYEPSGMATQPTTTSVTTTTMTTTGSESTSTSATTTTMTTTTATETTAPVDVKLGDVDEDGELTVSDAVLLARLVVGDKTVKVTEQGQRNGDCDGVSGISADDLTKLLQVLAKKTTF